MRPDHRIVREAYKDAWRVRERTGQTDESLLLSALRVRCAAARYLEPGEPAHEALLTAWRDGVAPDRVATGDARGGGLRSAVHRVHHRLDEGGTAWMDLPRGHRALSRVRRANDALRRHLHRPVDLVPLTFTALPYADAVLRRGLESRPSTRTPWSEVRVWLRTGSARGSAAVLVGEAETGSTSLPHPVWEELRREAEHGVYADGRLEVTRAVGRPEAVTVGGLFCHLPRL
jgi:hypothetical protein